MAGHSQGLGVTKLKQHRDFEFNLRELAGSMGDFGTLFPLAVGLIVVNRLNPAGLFIMLGLTNIITGLVYRLPMPVEPKKVVSVAAIAQQWPASLVYASGLGLGITWFILAFTGWLHKIVAWTPLFVVRGIQLGLAVLLTWEGLKMMRPKPWLGVLAVIIVLTLRKNRYAPAALVLMALGGGIMAWQGGLQSLEVAIATVDLAAAGGRVDGYAPGRLCPNPPVLDQCGHRHGGPHPRLFSR